MRYIKNFNESFDIDTVSIDKMGRYLTEEKFRNETEYNYKKYINQHTVCVVIRQPKDINSIGIFKYFIDDSSDKELNINDPLKVLIFVKNSLYHYLITKNPMALEIKAIDKNDAILNKKNKLYSNLGKNLPSGYVFSQMDGYWLIHKENYFNEIKN